MGKRGPKATWTDEKIMEIGHGLIAWFKEEKNRVFMQGYLAEHGIHRQRISEWSSKFAEFSELMAEAKMIQEARLLELGSTQKLNPVFAIFALKNHHGYTDKQEIKTESVNYNYDPADLKTKTTDELIEMLNQETNTTH